MEKDKFWTMGPAYCKRGKNNMKKTPINKLIFSEKIYKTVMPLIQN